MLEAGIAGYGIGACCRLEHLPIEHELAFVMPLTDDEVGELSREASRLMHAEAVDTAQTAAYLAFFTTGNPTLRWLRSRSRAELADYVARPPQLAPSNRGATGRPWLRGIVATYLALHDLFAGGWPPR